MGVWTNETRVRKQIIDSWHLDFSYIKNWKTYYSLIFCYMDSIACLILSIRPENVRKKPFMHGYCCYYLTIELQTSAWLACNFFVNNYFLVRPLSDVPNKPVSLTIKKDTSSKPAYLESISGTKLPELDKVVKASFCWHDLCETAGQLFQRGLLWFLNFHDLAEFLFYFLNFWHDFNPLNFLLNSTRLFFKQTNYSCFLRINDKALFM